MQADEFDIDIYGDVPEEPSASNSIKKEDDEDVLTGENQKDGGEDVKAEPAAGEDTDMGQAAPDGDNSNNFVKEESSSQSKQKRKLDDRQYDAGATSALYIADLHWWTTDDDIRGWVNQSDCEDELKDITFSEHKVNGKSKGVAFVEFTSPQAASAVKSKIESGNTQPSYMGKRHTVSYTNPHTNPFRTLPKDAPQRDRPRGDGFQGGRGGGSDRGGHTPPVGMAPNAGMGMGAGMNMGGGGFRGRGGFTPRGSMGGGFMGNRGGFGGAMGPQGSPQAAFQTPMAGAFGGPNMPMQQFGGGNFQGGNFSHRGGMNAMRGGPAMRGRGGMGPNGMMGGAMGAMGGMGMGGAMGGMTGNMGAMGAGAGNMDGFNPMMGGSFGMGAMGPNQYPAPHFNPAFFGNNPQGAGGQWENPHGTKRVRPNE